MAADKKTSNNALMMTLLKGQDIFHRKLIVLIVDFFQHYSNIIS